VTYLYCLVRSSRKPALRRVSGGLPGAGSLRLVDAGRSLWLVVADVMDGEYSEAAIESGLKNLEWVSERAVGHEAIVEQFLSAPAVLPMQLFTIFTSDDRALAYVARDRRRIDRILTRIEGHVEWGVRLTWDEHAVRESVEKVHRAPRGARTSGSQYLARKRDLLDVNRVQLAAARAAATKFHRQLTKSARDAVRRTSTEQAAPGSRLLLDAAYLVPAKQGAKFRSSLRAGARGLREAGIAASLTGPWPAYNFVGAR
jgi:hypothetical protein